MNNKHFCHLHVHTQYSLLDGYGSAEKYAKQAKKLGFEYLACTDHGSIDGLLDFQKECKKEKIKSVFGCEAYIVPDMKVKEKGEKRNHITLLVKNQQGWDNLCRLLTLANLQGFYYKPRIDFVSLLKYCDGLVILSGCVDTTLLKYEDFFWDLYDIIGEDLYLEVMPHDLLIQREVNKTCYEIYEAEGVKLVATNDCHYVEENDSEVQEVLLAVQTKAKWNDPKRWRFSIKGLHLRSADEMKKSFEKQEVLNKFSYLSAMRNTLLVAEKCCHFKIKKRDISLPKPPIKVENVDKHQILEYLCQTSFFDKFKHELETDTIYHERFTEEINLIVSKKFTRYFFVVYELVNWCKESGIMVGPGRGSVSGSLIAYLLGITTVDPIRFGLLFSRFISEDRIDFPDIDLDFEDSKRHLVRGHLELLYGKDNVAGVSTFLRMKGRSAIRDVARVFEVPYKEVDTFAKIIEDSPGKVKTKKSFIKAALSTSEGRYFYKRYPVETELAIKLEGQLRGCVSGDSRAILLRSDGRAKVKKIKHLYKENFKGQIRAYDFKSDVLFFDNVVNITKVGVKKVIEIITARGSLILTKDHRLLTRKGWVRAGFLKVGDKIASNGKRKKDAWNKGLTGEEYLSHYKEGRVWNKGLTKKDHDSILHSSIRMRINNPMYSPQTVEKMTQTNTKHGLHSKKLREFLVIYPICEICGGKSEDIHHIDKNRKNNDWSNLMALCHSCHSKLHKHSMKINPKMTISYVRIKSIKEVKEEVVYDIAMKSINQNFVCNKIIVHNSGAHAAACIVSKFPLTQEGRCNLVNRNKNIVVNWDMEDCEYQGLMKLDLLGLSTLSMLSDARVLLRKKLDEEFDFTTIDLGDKKTLHEFAMGHNIGIFQFNSPGMMKLCQDLKIGKFEDLVNANALYRPGPLQSGITAEFVERKKGAKWVKKSKVVEEITKDTYGLIIYQEQIMQLANTLAGLPWQEADKIRKVIAKSKGAKELAKFKKSFIDGCLEEGSLARQEIERLWDEIEEFGGYGFNLSHATSYSMLSYWAQYLKVHHPTEFISVCLSHSPNDKKSALVKEAYRLGLRVMTPKVGLSDAKQWRAKDNCLYAPFIEVKGIGDKTALKCLDIKPRKKIGFFQVRKTTGQTKYEKLLEEIKAFEPNQLPDNLSAYFSFQVTTDLTVMYPKLHKLLGTRSLVRAIERALSCQVERDLIYKKRTFINEDLLKCANCSLAEESIAPVLPSKGRYNIAIVGEAPGKQEEEQGIGFVGDSGNLLWKILGGYGFERHLFHITNCCKCYPSRVRTPSKIHLKACWPWLRQELEDIDCKLVLAFGNTGLKTFSDKDSGITEFNGTTEWSEKIGAWVCWCMHPASVLYNPDNKALFEGGIKNFVEKIEVLGGIN